MKFLLLSLTCFMLVLLVNPPVGEAADIHFYSLNFDGYALQTSPVRGVIINSGSVSITGFTAAFSIDNGAVTTETFSGLNIITTAAYSFNFTGAALFSSTGSHTIKVWTSMPNGSADATPYNDTVKETVIVLQFAPPKIALLEEFNGEWCGYCPDGDYKAQLDVDSFPSQVLAIAYHTIDPLTISEGTSLDGFFNQFGTPSAMIDRYQFKWLTGVPSGRPWYDVTYERLQMVSPVEVVFSNYQYDSLTKQYSMDVSANFYGEASGNFQMDLVITEDSIFDSGQHNYYDDGTIDSTSPFVDAGDPIVNYAHNHVARIVVSAPSSTIPTSIPTSGGSYTATFAGMLSSTWNAHEIHYIGMVYKKSNDPENSQVLNSGALGLATLSPPMHEQSFPLSVYPNPMNDFSLINFTLGHSSPVKLLIYDAYGCVRRIQLQKELASGMHQVAWNGKDDAGNELASGIYFIVLTNGSSASTVRVMKQ